KSQANPAARPSVNPAVADANARIGRLLPPKPSVIVAFGRGGFDPARTWPWKQSLTGTCGSLHSIRDPKSPHAAPCDRSVPTANVSAGGRTRRTDIVCARAAPHRTAKSLPGLARDLSTR